MHAVVVGGWSSFPVKVADDVPLVSFPACDATAMLVAAATFLQEDAWHAVVVVACVDRDDSVASQT